MLWPKMQLTPTDSVIFRVLTDFKGDLLKLISRKSSIKKRSRDRFFLFWTMLAVID